MSSVKFKLNLTPPKSDVNIEYSDHLFLVGSCFTENIGTKLKHHLFKVFENPHGILFNPVSVANALEDCICQKKYTAQDLFLYNELWHSWQHHSRFSGLTPEEALTKINEAIAEAHQQLKSAKHLVITLGSAWLYELTKEAPADHGRIVANNHKAPATWFIKKLMKPAMLIDTLEDVVKKLTQFNPSLHIIFTISPVRHLREGLIENNRSKAVLIHAVHEIVASNNGVSYFPAYEYVIDDLRDYRFYAEDLVHPNYTATQYVWEKFVETFMSNATQQCMKQVAEIQLARQHKPFFAGSTEHQKFLNSMVQKTTQLQLECPSIDLSAAESFFKAAILK
jgi:hypothetical protein